MTARLAVVTFNKKPAVNFSFKYDVLGPLALENHRRYAARHGYDFIDDVPVSPDRPACWAKLPAILSAFETHEWVLWADSDTLIREDAAPLDDLCDPAFDMVVQSHAAFFRFIGVPVEQGMAQLPISTGVFLMQCSDWSRDFLARAYGEIAYVTHGEMWDGIGEQEAMIALLRRQPADMSRIRHVEGLQNHPRFLAPTDRFVHLYGNHARHLIPEDQCREALARWQAAILSGAPWPADLARFHWCCIQNKSAAESHIRGELEDFLYRPEDIGLRD